MYSNVFNLINMKNLFSLALRNPLQKVITHRFLGIPRLTGAPLLNAAIGFFAYLPVTISIIYDDLDNGFLTQIQLYKALKSILRGKYLLFQPSRPPQRRFGSCVMTQAMTLGRGSLRQPRQANRYRRSLRGSRTSKVGPEDPIFGSTGPAQDPGLRTPGPRVVASTA